MEKYVERAINTTCNDLESNFVISGEKPATNNMSRAVASGRTEKKMAVGRFRLQKNILGKHV